MLYYNKIIISVEQTKIIGIFEFEIGLKNLIQVGRLRWHSLPLQSTRAGGEMSHC